MTPTSLFTTKAKDLKQVVIVSTHHKPTAHPIVHRMATKLESFGVEVLLDVNGVKSLADLAKEADLVMAVGGDGTMLSTARRLVGASIPTLGVNLGKLGFLAEHDLEDMDAYLAGAAPEGWQIEAKIMLQVSINGETRYALNDVFIGQGVMNRLLNIDLRVDGRHATQYRADGLVISTPVGSTAYNLSLGGPILSQGLRAFVITPIAPHSLTNRPIAIEGSSVMTCSVQTSADELALVVDGQDRLNLKPNDSFQVCAAPTDFLLISSSKRSYFEILRSKLSWGKLPKLQE